MILVLSDTHSYYGTVNEQIRYAETELGVSISSVIHLGDFGIYKANLYNFFIKQKEAFIRPVYFIEGNHEDFDALPWLTKKYRDYFTHLKRGTVNNIDGYRFLCFGGAEYMDSMITQRGSEISDNDIDDCLAVLPEDVDIVLTHDCPTGIGMPNTPGLEYYGETGFSRSRELVEYFKPKLWLFGHHHKWFEHRDGHTAYYGFAAIWKGFGLLDKNFKMDVYHHEVKIPRNRSLLERVFVKMKIIR